MKLKLQKFSIVLIFIVSSLAQILFFLHLNAIRNINSNDHNKKSFMMILDLSSNMISSGYFQWDDMHEAFLDNDLNYINELFNEIYDINQYVSDISIIEEAPESTTDLFKIVNLNGDLFLDFTINDDKVENIITDKFVRVKMDIDEILYNIQFTKDFRFSDGVGFYDFIYDLTLDSLKPKLFFFQIVSALVFGILCSFILKAILYNHSHFFYETRGLEKIIFLFEQTEKYSANHSKHVATIAYILGKKYGLKGKKLKDLKVAGLLHDIGKISIPREILNKKGPLTEAEFTIVKDHPILSDNILKSFEELSHLRPFIKHHHEKMDGTGYPSGLKGDEILIESRIIAIADVFEALTGERPYRKPLEPSEAVRFMETMSVDTLILKILNDNLPYICKSIHKDLSTPHN